MNYWEECILEAFDDAGIEASSEQTQVVVDCVEGAYEVYGEAHGHDQIGPSDADDKRQIQQLTNDLKKECTKVRCEKCEGTGVEDKTPKKTSGELRANDCWTCRGTGRVSP